MRKFLIIGAACAAIAATSAAANAQERLWTGVAIGAGTGALVAGPPGALVGGVIGGVVGGPRVSRRHKECWYDRGGSRHCRWR